MKRTALVIALAWPLAGCVHLGFPKLGKPPAAAPAPASAAPACPGDLRADIQPEPILPDAAGFPAPVSDVERPAVASYLQWLSGYGAWGRAGWARAADAKAFCDKKPAPP